jgi:uncharacterized membrane protein YeiH
VWVISLYSYWKVVHLIISLGGGTLAAILTGTPCTAVVNGQILPSYLLGYILVNHMDPIFWLLSNAPGLDFLLLAVIDPTARVLGMASVINSRFPPTVQWALAVIIATGGGMIYRVQFARDYVIHNHVYVLGSLAAILVSLNHPALHPSWLNMDPIRTVVLVNVYAVLLFSLLYMSSSAASVPTTPTSPAKSFVLRDPPMISKNQSNQTSAAASPVKERKEESPARSPRATRSLRSRKKD